MEYAEWAEGNKETCPTVLESLKNKDWSVKRVIQRPLCDWLKMLSLGFLEKKS